MSGAFEIVAPRSPTSLDESFTISLEDISGDSGISTCMSTSDWNLDDWHLLRRRLIPCLKGFLHSAFVMMAKRSS